MEEVSTEYVKEAVDAGDANLVIVDSVDRNRVPGEEFEYERERIPGSVSIPQSEVGEEFPKRFDTDEEIIVYCGMASCYASPRVATRLESMGFEDVKDYEGGLLAWKEAGLETEVVRERPGATDARPQPVRPGVDRD